MTIWIYFRQQTVEHMSLRRFDDKRVCLSRKVSQRSALLSLLEYGLVTSNNHWFRGISRK